VPLSKSATPPYHLGCLVCTAQLPTVPGITSTCSPLHHQHMLPLAAPACRLARLHPAMDLHPRQHWHASCPVTSHTPASHCCARSQSLLRKVTVKVTVTAVQVLPLQHTGSLLQQHTATACRYLLVQHACQSGHRTMQAHMRTHHGTQSQWFRLTAQHPGA